MWAFSLIQLANGRQNLNFFLKVWRTIESNFIIVSEFRILDSLVINQLYSEDQEDQQQHKRSHEEFSLIKLKRKQPEHLQSMCCPGEIRKQQS